MKLQERLSTLYDLGEYLKKNEPDWQRAKEKAFEFNPWFVPDFIELAVENIIRYYLNRQSLEKWVEEYEIPDQNEKPITVGLTMAGNIPLVGFHDWLTIFMSGHYQRIKPSSKDDILIKHIVEYLHQSKPETKPYFSFAERLTGCDAYIATGSNNSGRYFEYYFRKYPHIIRRNRTSMAILTGQESPEELNNLADDMLLYFGLGCRNVSKILVPRDYPFEPLLRAMDKYNWMKDHTKFRNNYEYQLSLLILNNKYYMSTEAVLLVESNELFSPIAQIHYEFYDSAPPHISEKYPDSLQCLCGRGAVSFGLAQQPSLTDYADGVDTMKFALTLNK